jgi:hypothetical protein
MPRESLGKALVTCPQLLGVGIDSLRTGLEFLRALGIPRYLCMYCMEIMCLCVFVFVCVYTYNTHTKHRHVCVFVCVLVRYIIYIYIYIYIYI